MILVGRDKLQGFLDDHPDAKGSLGSWEGETKVAEWKMPHEVKNRYPKASIIGGKQVVFNICGNKYRLWTQIAYQTGIVLIRAIGTHEEYEKWQIK